MNHHQYTRSVTHLPLSDTLIVKDAPVQRSCTELGVCHQRKPACYGCTVHHYPDPRKINFAPGVIQRLPRLSRNSSRHLGAGDDGGGLCLDEDGLGVSMQRKAYPGRWSVVFGVLLEEGSGTAAEIAAAQTTLSAASVAVALSQLRGAGFANQIGNKQWGLTKAGIEAALNCEAEASAPKLKIGNHRSPFGMGS